MLDIERGYGVVEQVFMRVNGGARKNIWLFCLICLLLPSFGVPQHTGLLYILLSLVVSSNFMAFHNINMQTASRPKFLVQIFLLKSRTQISNCILSISNWIPKKYLKHEQNYMPWSSHIPAKLALYQLLYLPVTGKILLSVTKKYLEYSWLLFSHTPHLQIH